MWKYKSQTLLSIIGLAVGFTCFALATLWIRYEMTYDNFHNNAKQLYVIYAPSQQSQTGYSKNSVPEPLAEHLKNTFPEVKNATRFNPARVSTYTIDDVEFKALVISVDSSFLKIFDVKILEGSWEFMIPDGRKIAITQEKARQMFGNENPIGKTVISGTTELTICAIVSGMSKQSNYQFDFILPMRLMPPGGMFISMVNTVVELHPETNIEEFEKKLYEHEAVFAGWYTNKKFNTLWDFNEKIEKRTTLYARWNRAPRPKPN